MKKKHYYDFSYDIERPGWFCYYYQLFEIWNLIKFLTKKGLGESQIKILEIGIGNGTVSDFLRKRKLKIKTFDNDKRLKPDIIGDVRQIKFAKNSFHIVLCAEVLEHLDFSEFEKILEKLNLITKDFLILSLPEAFGSKLVCQAHCWEIGCFGKDKELVRNIICKKFLIIKEYNLPLWKYQKMFVLQKK